jgi:hypothetical protein
MSANYRHPGESRDPLDSRNAGSAVRAEGLLWIPAFAGTTVGRKR